MADDVSPGNILLADAADIEADIVSWLCLLHLLMVHLNGLYFTGNALSLARRHHNDLVPYFHDASLHPADRNNADPSDIIDILQRQAQRQMGWLLRLFQGIQCLEQGSALVPGH